MNSNSSTLEMHSGTGKQEPIVRSLFTKIRVDTSYGFTVSLLADMYGPIHFANHKRLHSYPGVILLHRTCSSVDEWKGINVESYI